MTRCSYIPPEGESVIAIAKERGGTTDGDIQALRDRFGCRAEAVYEAVEDDTANEEVYACAEHLGHLLLDRWWVVRPLRIPELSDVTISIVNTAGVAREGFGSPMILSQSPTWTPTVPYKIGQTVAGGGGQTYQCATGAPVVDLGTNPTLSLIHI